MHADKIEPLWCVPVIMFKFDYSLLMYGAFRGTTKVVGMYLCIQIVDSAEYPLLILDYAFATTVPVPRETLSEGAWLRWDIEKLTGFSFTDAQAGSASWHFRVFLAPPIDLLQLTLKVIRNSIRFPRT
ncbi:hypothetical protein DFS33DRAFT_889874 [Desarmillaria ectypa]|nr:hypothetical protein DFS33DRAFT_889874 [Desarmillaria ectypa]